MKKSIEIEYYNKAEAIGKICELVSEDKILEFAEDLKALKNIDENEEYFDYIEKLQEVSYKYTSGFWYCYEHECFFAEDDFSKGECPFCWLDNHYSEF